MFQSLSFSANNDKSHNGNTSTSASSATSGSSGRPGSNRGNSNVIHARGYSTHANTIQPDDTPSDTGPTPVETYFAAVFQPDTGGETTNVHHLATRHLNNALPPTADIINTVLASLDVSTTPAELAKLGALPSVRGGFTNRKVAPQVAAAIGSSSVTDAESKRKGVYIFTRIATGDKYVGGTTNAASRVRSYFKPKQPKTGKIRPALVKYGLDAFTVEFIHIPNSM